MFKQTLKKVVDNVDGGIAAVVMGLDGIPVEAYHRYNSIDINNVAMEFSFIMNQVRKAGASLQVGACDEVAIRSEGMNLILRMLTPQYFVAAATSATGNFGKCRYLVRVNAPALTSQL